MFHASAAIGSRAGFKHQMLWVRVPRGVPGSCASAAIGSQVGFKIRMLWVRIPRGIPTVLSFSVRSSVW